MRLYVELKLLTQKGFVRATEFPSCFLDLEKLLSNVTAVTESDLLSLGRLNAKFMVKGVSRHVGYQLGIWPKG